MGVPRTASDEFPASAPAIAGLQPPSPPLIQPDSPSMDRRRSTPCGATFSRKDRRLFLLEADPIALPQRQDLIIEVVTGRERLREPLRAGVGSQPPGGFDREPHRERQRGLRFEREETVVRVCVARDERRRERGNHHAWRIFDDEVPPRDEGSRRRRHSPGVRLSFEARSSEREDEIGGVGAAERRLGVGEVTLDVVVVAEHCHHELGAGLTMAQRSIVDRRGVAAASPCVERRAAQVERAEGDEEPDQPQFCAQTRGRKIHAADAARPGWRRADQPCRPSRGKAYD